MLNALACRVLEALQKDDDIKLCKKDVNYILFLFDSTKPDCLQ